MNIHDDIFINIREFFYERIKNYSISVTRRSFVRILQELNSECHYESKTKL